MRGEAQLAPLMISMPLIGAALLAPLGKRCPRVVTDALCSMVALATVVCGALLISATLHLGPITYWMGGWTPRHGIAIGISLYADPAGAGLATFIAFLVFIASIYTWKYFENVGTLFHSLLLAFLAAMCGYALTGDIFNMFVWFEMMSAVAIAITAHKIEESQAIEGAINLAVTNTIAGFIVLLGITLLYGRTGALNLIQLGHIVGAHPADALIIVAFTLILCGYFIKGAIAPFHFWLDDAHAVASTPVCILFSGIMVQLALYGVARVYWTVFSTALLPYEPKLRALLIGVGIVTALAGAFMAFAQRHLKRLLAFSTVSHSGMFVAALGLFNAAGLATAGLFILAHGLIKSALFVCAGNYLNRFRSLDEEVLGGRGRETPINSTLYIVGGLALAGLPPFAIAAAKTWYDDAMHERGLIAVAVCLAVATAIDGAAVLRSGLHIAFGIGRAQHTGWSPREEETEVEQERLQRIAWPMLAPAFILLAAAAWLGLSGAFWQHVASAASLFVTRSHVVPPLHLTLTDIGINLGVVALAVAFAFMGLFRDHIPEKLASILGTPTKTLRLLHSGAFPDYIAYMMFGLAAYGIWLVTSAGL